MTILRTAAAAAAMVMCSSASMADPSYPLACRGGPSMRIVVNHDVPDGVHTGATHMQVYFRAGSVPGNPGPGECVWMDRTFRPGEPQNFWLTGNVEFAFQVGGDARLIRDTTGWRLNPEGSSPAANDWAHITQAVLDRGTFTVQVYNAGGRTMAVTSVGP